MSKYNACLVSKYNACNLTREEIENQFQGISENLEKLIRNVINSCCFWYSNNMDNAYDWFQML